MESKDFISTIKFRLRKENGGIVFFNVQSVTFQLSIRKYKFLIKKSSVSRPKNHKQKAKPIQIITEPKKGKLKVLKEKLLSRSGFLKIY